MGLLRTAALVLLLAIFAATPAASAKELPPHPHKAMDKPLGCNDCHNSYGGNLDPHQFVVPIPETCWVCHTQERLGRSHPIGVDPRYAAVKVDIPDDLPLEDGKVSCGSCHQPHRDHISKTKAFAEQPVKFRQQIERKEVRWFSTLFLRKSDPVHGFEPLCLACHKDM